MTLQEQEAAATAIQAFCRGCMSRQKVSEWIAVLIEELRVAKEDQNFDSDVDTGDPENEESSYATEDDTDILAGPDDERNSSNRTGDALGVDSNATASTEESRPSDNPARSSRTDHRTLVASNDTESNSRTSQPTLLSVPQQQRTDDSLSGTDPIRPGIGILQEDSLQTAQDEPSKDVAAAAAAAAAAAPETPEPSGVAADDKQNDAKKLKDKEQSKSKTKSKSKSRDKDKKREKSKSKRSRDKQKHRQKKSSAASETASSTTGNVSKLRESFSEKSKSDLRKNLQRQDSWAAKRFSKSSQQNNGGKTSRKANSLFTDIDELEDEDATERSGESARGGSVASKRASFARGPKRGLPASPSASERADSRNTEDSFVPIKGEAGSTTNGDQTQLSRSDSEEEFEIIDGLRFPKFLPKSIMSDSDEASAFSDTTDTESWNDPSDTQPLVDGHLDDSFSVQSSSVRSVQTATGTVSSARAIFESKKPKDTRGPSAAMSVSKRGNKSTKKDSDAIGFAARQYLMHSSATRIQAHIRGYLYRKKDFEAMMGVVEWVQHYQVKEAEVAAQRIIQQQASAVKREVPVEASKRRNAFSERQRLMRKAATKIQALVRGFLARKVDYEAMMDALTWIEEFREMEQAEKGQELEAVENLAEDKARSDKTDGSEPPPPSAFARRQLKRFNAAVKIQSLARGYLCRRVDLKATAKAIKWVQTYQKWNDPSSRPEEEAGEESEGSDGSENPEIEDVVKVVSFLEGAQDSGQPDAMFTQETIQEVLETHAWLQNHEADASDAIDPSSNEASPSQDDRSDPVAVPKAYDIETSQPEMTDLVRFYEWVSTNKLSFGQTVGENGNVSDGDGGTVGAASGSSGKPSHVIDKTQMKELKEMWSWLESKNMDMSQFKKNQSSEISSAGSEENAEVEDDGAESSLPLKTDESGTAGSGDRGDGRPTLKSMVKYWNFSKAMLFATEDDDSDNSEPLEWIVDDKDDDSRVGSGVDRGTEGIRPNSPRPSKRQSAASTEYDDQAPLGLQRYSARKDSDEGLPMAWNVDADTSTTNDSRNEGGKRQRPVSSTTEQRARAPSVLQRYAARSDEQDDEGPIEWKIDSESDGEETELKAIQDGAARSLQGQQRPSRFGRAAGTPSELHKYTANNSKIDGERPIAWVVDDGSGDEQDDEAVSFAAAASSGAHSEKPRQRPSQASKRRDQIPSVLQKYKAGSDDEGSGPIEWAVDDDDDDDEASACTDVKEKQAGQSVPPALPESNTRCRPSRALNQREKAPSVLQKYAASNSDDDAGPIEWVIDDNDSDGDNNQDGERNTSKRNDAGSIQRRQRPTQDVTRSSRMPSVLERYSARKHTDMDERPIAWTVDEETEDDKGEGAVGSEPSAVATNPAPKQSRRRPVSAKDGQRLRAPSALQKYTAKSSDDSDDSPIAWEIDDSDEEQEPKPNATIGQNKNVSVPLGPGQAIQETRRVDTRMQESSSLPSELRKYSAQGGTGEEGPIEWAINEGDTDAEEKEKDTAPRSMSMQRQRRQRAAASSDRGQGTRMPSVLQRYSRKRQDEEEEAAPTAWVVNEKEGTGIAGKTKDDVRNDSFQAGPTQHAGSDRRRPQAQRGPRSKVPSVLAKYSAKKEDNDNDRPIAWVIDDEDSDREGGNEVGNVDDIAVGRKDRLGKLPQKPLLNRPKPRPGLGMKEPSFVRRYSSNRDADDGAPISWSIDEDGDENNLNAGPTNKPDTRKASRPFSLARNPSHRNMMKTLDWLSKSGMPAAKANVASTTRDPALPPVSEARGRSETPALASDSDTGARKVSEDTLESPSKTTSANTAKPANPRQASPDHIKNSLEWLQKKGISTNGLGKKKPKKNTKPANPSIRDMQKAMKWMEQETSQGTSTERPTGKAPGANGRSTPSKEEMERAMKWMADRDKKGEATDAKPATDSSAAARVRPKKVGNKQKPRQKSTKPPSAADMETALSWLAKQKEPKSFEAVDTRDDVDAPIDTSSVSTGEDADQEESGRSLSASETKTGKSRTSFSAPPSASDMEKALHWLQKAEKIQSPTTEGSKKIKMKQPARNLSIKVKQAMLNLGGSDKPKPRTTKPEVRVRPKKAGAKPDAAVAPKLSADEEKALAWLEKGQADDDEMAAHYKRLDSILPKRSGQSNTTRAKELAKAMKWVKKKGLGFATDQDSVGETRSVDSSDGNGRVFSPRGRRKGSVPNKEAPSPSLRGRKQASSTGREYVPGAKQRKIRAQKDSRRYKDCDDASVSSAKKQDKPSRPQGSVRSDSELTDLKNAMQWLQHKDDDSLPDAQYFRKLDSMLPKRHGQTIRERAKEMAKALHWVRQTSIAKPDAVPKAKTSRWDKAKGKLAEIREGEKSDKKTRTARVENWGKVTASLSKIKADRDAENALRYLQDGRSVDKADADYFKRLDTMLPKREGQSEQERAVEMSKAMKFLRKKGIDSKKDDATSTDDSTAATYGPEDDLRHAVKWLEYKAANKSTHDLPDAEHFKKLDKMLPKKPGQKNEARAEEMVKMLAWMKKKKLNIGGRR